MQGSSGAVLAIYHMRIEQSQPTSFEEGSWSYWRVGFVVPEPSTMLLLGLAGLASLKPGE